MSRPRPARGIRDEHSTLQQWNELDGHKLANCFAKEVEKEKEERHQYHYSGYEARPGEYDGHAEKLEPRHRHSGSRQTWEEHANCGRPQGLAETKPYENVEEEKLGAARKLDLLSRSFVE
jgi:hypothetical protein